MRQKCLINFSWQTGCCVPKADVADIGMTNLWGAGQCNMATTVLSWHQLVK